MMYNVLTSLIVVMAMTGAVVWLVAGFQAVSWLLTAYADWKEERRR